MTVKTTLAKHSITSEDQSKLIAPPASLSLKEMLLADNRLTEDIFQAVAQLPELRVLNLSFNEIFEVPPTTLSKLSKLESLYLSGNKLTSLPAEDLEKLSKLRTLHLNGNKLKTLPSELGTLTALQHLDVGSNVLKYNIANWPYDWNWLVYSLVYVSYADAQTQELEHCPAIPQSVWEQAIGDQAH